MADLTVTRFGSIDTALARVAQQSIADRRRAAVYALNDVHFRLVIDYSSPGISPVSEPPLQRWDRLVEELFSPSSVPCCADDAPTDPVAGTAPAVWGTHHLRTDAVSVLESASEDHIAVVIKLLVAAGTFLVAESVTLSEQLELALAMAGESASGLLVSDVVGENLDTAMATGRSLLDHATPQNVKRLLLGGAETGGVRPARSESAVPTEDAPAEDDATNTVVLVVDMTSSIRSSAEFVDVLAARARRSLRLRYLSYAGAQEKGLVVVVSTFDGRQSKAIPLTPSFTRYRDAVSSRRWLDHALDEIEGLLRLLCVESSPIDRIDPFMRWEYTAETLGMAAAALDADHIILVSDANSLTHGVREALAGDAVAATVPASENTQHELLSPSEVVERLKADDVLPDLTGRSVTVINPTFPEEDLSEHWITLCSAANAVSCEIDLGHTEATHEEQATAAKPAPVDQVTPVTVPRERSPRSGDHRGVAHRSRSERHRGTRSGRRVPSGARRRADEAVAGNSSDNLVAYMIDEPRSQLQDILLVLVTAVTSIAVAVMAMLVLSDTGSRAGIGLTAIVGIVALLIPASGGFAWASRNRREIPIVLHRTSLWESGPTDRSVDDHPGDRDRLDQLDPHVKVAAR